MISEGIGTRLRRLPISSTCSSVLMLHPTYEDNEVSRNNFENDLDIGFFCADGFDERLYRDNYARIERNQFPINHTEIQNFDSNVRNNAEEIVVIDLTLDTTDEEIINENNDLHNEQIPNLNNDSRNELTPTTISSPSTNNSRNELTPTTISSPSTNNSRNELTPTTISSPSTNNSRDELTPTTISSPSINMFDDEPNEWISTLSRNKRGNRSNSNESSRSSSSSGRSSGRRQNYMESVTNDNWNILLPENIENQLKRRNKRNK